MNFRPLVVTAGLLLLLMPSSKAQPSPAPVKLRYHFAPGQTLRYLIQCDPYFDNPIGAVETTDPNIAYRPPVVERLTEEVQAVGSDGAATVQVTIGPEPGFEDEANPQPFVTRTVRVTPLGQVLTPITDPAMRGLLRAFFRLPAASMQVGEIWKGQGPQGTDKIESSAVLTAEQGGSRGQAIIRQTLPPTVVESRSPDHDGTLLQTTRCAQTDRIVFDVGAGSLRRQTSTLTVTLSLVMTGRGTRGVADFGHVIPNVQVTQTMTIERQDDPPPLPTPATSLPASTERRSKS